MAGVLRHPDWHLISEQRFRHRAGIVAAAQVMRGRRTLVLSDGVGAKVLRLTRRAEALWLAFDGQRTVAEIWRDLSERSADAPSQAEVVDWLMRLVASGLLLSDRKMDPRHLTARVGQARDRQLEGRVASPLSIKIALIDPAPIVRATYPLVRPFFSRAGGLAGLALVMLAAFAMGRNWASVAASVDGEVLSQSGAVLLILTYPLMKTLHEMSHGWTLHHFGGRLREAGVMLLLFVPVPYVDASEASLLAERRARMLVGAAGIFAEVIVASAAFLVWLAVEPGLLKAVMFSLVITGTVSTLLFNGNPLLKFDAYYVLCDWLELPNLAQRAGDYLAERFLVRVGGVRPELGTLPGEAPILLAYAVAALAYRLALMFVIAALVSQMFYALGLALAALAVVTGLVWPLARTLWRGWGRAARQVRRRRFGTRMALFGGALLAFSALVPMPFAVIGAGLVLPSDGATLRAATSGVVEAVLVDDGAEVAQGLPLLTLREDNAAANRTVTELRLKAVRDRLSRPGLTVEERRQAEAQAEVLQKALALADQRHTDLTLSAPFAGRLGWQQGAAPSPGRFLNKGEAVGFVLTDAATEVLLAFPAAYAGLVGPGADVRLILADGSQRHLPAGPMRSVDAGGVLPSALLAPYGGPVPATAEGTALTPQLVIRVTGGAGLEALAGQRVQARIDMAPRPLLAQLAFHLRNLFLRAIRV